MIAILKIFPLISLFIILISCNKTSTEPELQAGRRDYNWSVDTINPGYEALYLNRIWGTSPKDVWAIGNSSWSATTIWYYNGSQWRCDSVPRYVQPTSIFGLSSNQVWLGNGNNTIWRHDGNQWQKFGEYTITGYDKTCINNFCATSGLNIYGVGFVELYGANKWKAMIIRYDGTNWNFITSVPETKVSFETVAIEAKSNTLVMSGSVNEQNGFMAKIYYWNGVELKELLSENGSSFVTKLGDEIFVTLNSKIYKYSDKTLTLWKNNDGTTINGNIICGRSRNDFFIGSSNGIAHYNGSDFILAFKTNLNVRQGIIFNNDVFFIGKDYSIGKNYIIHGQLK